MTEEIANELLDYAARKVEPLSRSAQEFVERTLGEDVPSYLTQGH